MFQYRNIFISSACAFFVYILLLIYESNNENNTLISIALGLFIYILLSLQTKKETFQDVKPIPITLKMDTSSETKKHSNQKRKKKNQKVKLQKIKKHRKYKHLHTCNICKEIIHLLEQTNVDEKYDNLLKIYNEVIILYNNITQSNIQCSKVITHSINRLQKQKLMNITCVSRVPSQKLNTILTYNVPIGTNVKVIQLLNAITEKIEKYVNEIIDNKHKYTGTNSFEYERLKVLNEKMYSTYYRPIIDSCVKELLP
tara:strand:+ start:1998 stop:2765 length:768 start_codon:yes stop_codon:yes gene_type:complete